MPSPRKLWPALFVCVAFCLQAAAARAYEPRVTEDFFGVSAPDLYKLSGEDREAELDGQLASIKGAGLDWVRAEIGWADIEPSAPIAGNHIYNWSRGDHFVRSLSLRGLSLVPILMATPSWARSPAAIAAGCGRGAGVSPTAAIDYAAFGRAVVRRYGPGGAFWAANPSLPYTPITKVELFNEPNWAHFWCPGPDPVAYGLAVSAAGLAIHAERPETTVIAGGMVAIKPGNSSIASGQGAEVETFLNSVALAAPSVTGAVDAIAVHLYHPDPDVDVGLLAWFRARLDDAGFADAKIVVNEFGWRTSGGGSGEVSEAGRAALFEELTGKFARTDCGVIGVAPHTWVTQETDPNDPEHWFGLTSPATGTLYPSGKAYRDQVALYEGRGPTPAPRATLHACGNEPPDSDGDGVSDEDDDYPTDPSKDSGSGEEPPLPPSPPVPRHGARVQGDFFGATLGELPWQIEPRRSHLTSMDEAGIARVRAMVDWSHLQWVRGEHVNWDETDTLTLQLAQRGIGLVPYVGSPPAWVVGTDEWNELYVEFLGRYARRYGPNGTFWDENGHLDPALAPTQIEISPVGNSQAHWWRGSNSAGEYADLVLAAQSALTVTSPGVEAVPSFYDVGDRGAASDYLRWMVGARPALAGTIESVYVYANSPTQAGVDKTTEHVRTALDATGNSGAAIQLGFGWPTRGEGAMSEAARADRLGEFASRFARSDCNVERIFASAWSTAERDSQNHFDWYGMAAPADGELRATGEAYAQQIESFTGFAKEPAPRTTVHTCGQSDRDQDGDGVVDPDDDFPVDPERFDGEGPAITASLKQTRKGRHMKVSFTAIDRSGLGAFECKLDRADWTPCDSPYVATDLKSGRHVVRLGVADEWGNASEVVKRWKARG